MLNIIYIHTHKKYSFHAISYNFYIKRWGVFMKYALQLTCIYMYIHRILVQYSALIPYCTYRTWRVGVWASWPLRWGTVWGCVSLPLYSPPGYQGTKSNNNAVIRQQKLKSTEYTAMQHLNYQKTKWKCT